MADAAFAELPDGPHDVELFFDPSCPFAWQTSVWVRRVQELRGLEVGWRFFSLRFLNEHNDLPPAFVEAQQQGLRYHRICAAARAEHGNEAVGALYRGWGERYWSQQPPGDLGARVIAAVAAVDVSEILAANDLPASLAAAADDASWDGLIRAETDEALGRIGDDAGTPVLTFGPPTGGSLFGPVITRAPEGEAALALYDALAVLADLPGFTKVVREPGVAFDLPLVAGA